MGGSGLSPSELGKPRLGFAQLLQAAASFEGKRVAVVAWLGGGGGERLVEHLSFPLVFLGAAFSVGTGTSSWKMRGISSS